jgi:hypothetical protein
VVRRARRDVTLPVATVRLRGGAPRGGPWRAPSDSVVDTETTTGSQPRAVQSCSKLPARSARGSATQPEEVPLGVCRRHGGRTLVGGRGLAVPA